VHIFLQELYQSENKLFEISVSDCFELSKLCLKHFFIAYFSLTRPLGIGNVHLEIVADIGCVEILSEFEFLVQGSNEMVKGLYTVELYVKILQL
jgi:hypothetical protein